MKQYEFIMKQTKLYTLKPLELLPKKGRGNESEVWRIRRMN
jgi:hypothetical protein